MKDKGNFVKTDREREWVNQKEREEHILILSKIELKTVFREIGNEMKNNTRGTNKKDRELKEKIETVL